MNTVDERAALYLDRAANLIEDTGQLARGDFAREEGRSDGLTMSNLVSPEQKPRPDRYCVRGALRRVMYLDTERGYVDRANALRRAEIAMAFAVGAQPGDRLLGVVSRWSDSLESHTEAVATLREVATAIRKGDK